MFEMYYFSIIENFGVDVVMMWECLFDKWECVKFDLILFVQIYFVVYEKYLDGIVDMVGYWVEDCIFGGVFFFDYFDIWSDEMRFEFNVYIYLGRDKVIFWICQFFDE